MILFFFNICFCIFFSEHSLLYKKIQKFLSLYAKDFESNRASYIKNVIGPKAEKKGGEIQYEICMKAFKTDKNIIDGEKKYGYVSDIEGEIFVNINSKEDIIREEGVKEFLKNYNSNEPMNNRLHNVLDVLDVFPLRQKLNKDQFNFFKEIMDNLKSHNIKDLNDKIKLEEEALILKKKNEELKKKLEEEALILKKKNEELTKKLEEKALEDYEKLKKGLEEELLILNERNEELNKELEKEDKLDHLYLFDESAKLNKKIEKLNKIIEEGPLKIRPVGETKFKPIKINDEEYITSEEIIEVMDSLLKAVTKERVGVSFKNACINFYDITRQVLLRNKPERIAKDPHLKGFQQNEIIFPEIPKTHMEGVLDLTKLTSLKKFWNKDISFNDLSFKEKLFKLKENELKDIIELLKDEKNINIQKSKFLKNALTLKENHLNDFLLKLSQKELEMSVKDFDEMQIEHGKISTEKELLNYHKNIGTEEKIAEMDKRWIDHRLILNNEKQTNLLEFLKKGYDAKKSVKEAAYDLYNKSFDTKLLELNEKRSIRQHEAPLLDLGKDREALDKERKLLRENTGEIVHELNNSFNEIKAKQVQAQQRGKLYNKDLVKDWITGLKKRNALERDVKEKIAILDKKEKKGTLVRDQINRDGEFFKQKLQLKRETQLNLEKEKFLLFKKTLRNEKELREVFNSQKQAYNFGNQKEELEKNLISNYYHGLEKNLISNYYKNKVINLKKDLGDNYIAKTYNFVYDNHFNVILKGMREGYDAFKYLYSQQAKARLGWLNYRTSPEYDENQLDRWLKNIGYRKRPFMERGAYNIHVPFKEQVWLQATYLKDREDIGIRNKSSKLQAIENKRVFLKNGIENFETRGRVLFEKMGWDNIKSKMKLDGEEDKDIYATLKEELKIAGKNQKNDFYKVYTEEGLKAGDTLAGKPRTRGLFQEVNDKNEYLFNLLPKDVVKRAKEKEMNEKNLLYGFKNKLIRKETDFNNKTILPKVLEEKGKEKGEEEWQAKGRKNQEAEGEKEGEAQGNENFSKVNNENLLTLENNEKLLNPYVSFFFKNYIVRKKVFENQERALKEAVGFEEKRVALENKEKLFGKGSELLYNSYRDYYLDKLGIKFDKYIKGSSRFYNKDYRPHSQKQVRDDSFILFGRGRIGIRKKNIGLRRRVQKLKEDDLYNFSGESKSSFSLTPEELQSIQMRNILKVRKNQLYDFNVFNNNARRWEPFLKKLEKNYLYTKMSVRKDLLELEKFISEKNIQDLSLSNKEKEYTFLSDNKMPNIFKKKKFDAITLNNDLEKMKVEDLQDIIASLKEIKNNGSLSNSLEIKLKEVEDFSKIIMEIYEKKYGSYHKILNEDLNEFIESLYVNEEFKLNNELKDFVGNLNNDIINEGVWNFEEKVIKMLKTQELEVFHGMLDSLKEDIILKDKNDFFKEVFADTHMKFFLEDFLKEKDDFLKSFIQEYTIKYYDLKKREVFSKDIVNLNDKFIKIKNNNDFFKNIGGLKQEIVKEYNKSEELKEKIRQLNYIEKREDLEVFTIEPLDAFKRANFLIDISNNLMTCGDVRDTLGVTLLDKKINYNLIENIYNLKGNWDLLNEKNALKTSGYLLEKVDILNNILVDQHNFLLEQSDYIFDFFGPTANVSQKFISSLPEYIKVQFNTFSDFIKDTFQDFFSSPNDYVKETIEHFDDYVKETIEHFDDYVQDNITIFSDFFYRMFENIFVFIDLRQYSFNDFFENLNKKMSTFSDLNFNETFDMFDYFYCLYDYFLEYAPYGFTDLVFCLVILFLFLFVKMFLFLFLFLYKSLEDLYEFLCFLACILFNHFFQKGNFYFIEKVIADYELQEGQLKMFYYYYPMHYFVDTSNFIEENLELDPQAVLQEIYYRQAVEFGTGSYATNLKEEALKKKAPLIEEADISYWFNYEEVPSEIDDDFFGENDFYNDFVRDYEILDKDLTQLNLKLLSWEFFLIDSPTTEEQEVATMNKLKLGEDLPYTNLLNKLGVYHFFRYHYKNFFSNTPISTLNIKDYVTMSRPSFDPKINFFSNLVEYFSFFDWTNEGSDFYPYCGFIFLLLYVSFISYLFYPFVFFFLIIFFVLLS